MRTIKNLLLIVGVIAIGLWLYNRFSKQSTAKTATTNTLGIA